MPDTWHVFTGFDAYRYPSDGKGSEFHYRFSIRNDGPVAVTIKGISFADPGFIVSASATGMIPGIPGAGTVSGFQPFHRFTLDPGENAGIELTVRQNFGCIDGVLGPLAPVDVDLSVLGFERHVDFTPDPQVAVYSTKACPSHIAGG